MAKFNKTTFSSIDEYQDYLQNLFDYLAQSGDYNIYMHQVCSHRTFLFDNIEEKIELLNIYKSQIRQSPSPINGGGVKKLAALRGIEIGCEYAEMFYLQKMKI